MKLSEKRMLQKKEQILLSAIKIVNKYGFEQATMEQIAAALYMTKGALYYYFRLFGELFYLCTNIREAELDKLFVPIRGILLNGLQSFLHWHRTECFCVASCRCQDVQACVLQGT